MEPDNTILSRTAVISEDGLYRYRLDRRFPEGRGAVTFVMLNPSTADALLDDPTIRKCVGFARRWGKQRIYVVNLFAYRATKPGALALARSQGVDVVGPDNRAYVTGALEGADTVVAAWGRNVEPWKWARPELDEVSRFTSLKCLGVTAGGSPRHLLMVAYSTELVDYYSPLAGTPKRGQ